MTGRAKVVVVLLPAAVLSLALGCKSKTSRDNAHPIIEIQMDANNPIPSCYANPGWVSLAGNGSIDWTAASGDSNTYQVQFPVTPSPLVDSSGSRVTAPIIVNSSGTQSGAIKGPFSINASAVYTCKAGADAGQCYVSYDIKTNGHSCVQHYGSGVGAYTSGIHIER